ncbi:hypothetical protein FRB95_007254 [Tulasnella sp. JGI-2019a]|nr:hypothetical protein FRB93_000449 [Tulasnella sp. JGI-2019a]KAG9039827.1 hypothetical protein FRB95_007254 [Tulasnella sp. JGI-2019a]
MAKASVSRVLDDEVTQRVRDRSAQAEQQRKERHVQMLDTPPTMGKKSGAAASNNKKRKSVGAGTASSLARNVLQKGVTVKARNEGSSSAPVSSASATVTPPPTQHRNTLASSNGNSSSSNSLDTTSLRAQVIHQLALKPSTSKELRSLSGKTSETETLSDILRSVAMAEDSPITKPIQMHWSKSFASPSQHGGPWYLQREFYASSVHPFTWPSYEDADRRRIADETFTAMDELDLPADAPERRRLLAEQSSWLKRRKMEGGGDNANASDQLSVGSSSKPSTPAMLPAARKVKMNKMSEPRMSNGSTLSAPAFRGGMVKSASSTGATTTKDKKSPLHTSLPGDQTRDREPEKGGRSTPSETKKRPSPPSNLSSSASGRATPVPSTTKSNLAHPLPAKPQTSLAPPSSSSTIRQSSRTPPSAPVNNGGRSSSIQPSRTSTPIPSPGHAHSASMSSTSTVPKRKREDETAPSSRIASSGHDAKKPKVDRQLAAATTSKGSTSNGASSMSKKAGASKTEPGAKAPDSRASVSSSKQSQSQSLKAPTLQPNGKSPPGRAAAITATSKPERHLSPMPKFTKKDASPAPPAYHKPASKEKDLPPIPTHSKKRPEHAPEKKSSRRRQDIDYTDSSEEEEEEAPPAGTKFAKTKVMPQSLPSKPAPERSSRPTPLDLPRSDRNTPLPQDEEALRELFSARYAESSEILARLTREKVKLERALRGDIDDEGMLDHESIDALSKGYHELQGELEAIKAALERS